MHDWTILDGEIELLLSLANSSSLLTVAPLNFQVTIINILV